MDLKEAPQFLTVDELSREVARYSYRPGWRLSVYQHPWEGPFFRVVTDVPDSYHPGDTVELRINSPIPPIPSAEYFGHWLTWRLGMIESHESREFLKRDGSTLNDPHDFIEPVEVSPNT